MGGRWDVVDCRCRRGAVSLGSAPFSEIYTVRDELSRDADPILFWSVV